MQLLDDPDAIVYETVTEKIISFGPQILPNLQAQIQQAATPVLQERIEELIHKVSFTEIKNELSIWSTTDSGDLYEAALLVCKYHSYDLFNENDTRKKLKSIYQSTWLELNNYLSPIEQINVISSILYNMYRLQGNEPNTKKINQYFLDATLNSKDGNAYSLGLVYLILSLMLDIPIFAVDIPHQFLLAYFDATYNFLQPKQKQEASILFYIDPTNGMVYTQDDVAAYLKKIKTESKPSMYLPLNNKQVMHKYLQALLACFTSKQLINSREKEILQLIEIVKPT